jgi:hypothetical protein
MSDIQSTLAGQGRKATQDDLTQSSNITFSDPDAAYRPFVTPYYSSRPDGNCGKVGDAEGL